MSTKTALTPNSAKAKVSEILVQLKSLKMGLDEAKKENAGDSFLSNVHRAVENAENTLEAAQKVLLEKYKIASTSTGIDESLSKLASVLNSIK